MELGLLDRLDHDHDGREETYYRITDAGLGALNAQAGPDPLPEIRDQARSVNHRYRGSASPDPEKTTDNLT